LLPTQRKTEELKSVQLNETLVKSLENPDPLLKVKDRAAKAEENLRHLIVCHAELLFHIIQWHERSSRQTDGHRLDDLFLHLLSNDAFVSQFIPAYARVCISLLTAKKVPRNGLSLYFTSYVSIRAYVFPVPVLMRVAKGCGPFDRPKQQGGTTSGLSHWQRNTTRIGH